MEQQPHRSGEEDHDRLGDPARRDGRCSFESILLKYGLQGDPGLATLARVVHAADVAADIDVVPEGRGLKAIASGFRLMLGSDDHAKIRLETPLYDALYEWARRNRDRP